MTVIRGKARGGGKQLGTYLMTQGENDVMPKAIEVRGTAYPDNVQKSLVEMSLTSELTKTDRGLWHLQLNPAPGEDQTITPEGWIQMADITEKHLGLEGQKRVIVEHEKNGRRHIHVAWERYDHDAGKMIDIKYSRLKQRSAVMEIERSMGLKMTPMRNISEKDVKVTMSALWQQTGGGKEFVKEAARMGFTVALSNERRPYKVMDNASGRSFDLVRQLEGVRTRDVRASLKDADLPAEKVVRRERAAKKHGTELDRKQDQAMHALEMFRETEAAKAEQQLKFTEKLNAMKESAPEITQPKAAPPVEPKPAMDLSDKQDAFMGAIDKFKKDEDKKRQAAALDTMKDNGFGMGTPPPAPKENLTREERKRKFIDELERQERERQRDRDRDFER